MTVEITSRDTLDPTICTGSFGSFVQELNLAAAAGHQYVVAKEIRADGEAHVALETRNITRIRDLGDSDSLIG